MSSDERLLSVLRLLSKLEPDDRAAVLAALPPDVIDIFHSDFDLFAHAHQRPPDFAADGRPWRTWLILGGRGAGKTRAGAEWVRHVACSDAKARIALVGETEHDVRSVMIEGASGLMAVHPRSEKLQWYPTRRRIEWPNGAIAEVFSSENHEGLRGPQFTAAWCDELAKWRQAEATFDMLQFGLRLGERPRQVITTTPRPIVLLKKLMADPTTALTRAGTVANALNLSASFVEQVFARYKGTRLGRQELDGEIVEERADALWTRAGLESCRVAAPPELTRIVVAIDPPASSKRGADACGIVAAGRAGDGTLYVLEDGSIAGASPQGWASRAITLWRKYEADALIAEINQGGEMVSAVLRSIDSGVPVTTTRATRGKYHRAEPVSQLYEQGRVKHAGNFPALEDEMCDFGLDGLSSGHSPDRLDALVWAVAALTFAARPEPRIRQL
ncbi:terminase large subunit domain-containing protein [Undibacter mobilis]|uniref:DNA-packaging protein n=1 Tax=Undibacter mobilis TaxID=2292256 RepID=UPI001AECFE6E